MPQESEAERLTLLGKPSACVGRDRELANLSSFFNECTSEPVARAVLMLGPGGAGKTRIRKEFVRHVRNSEQRAEVIFAQGDSLSAGAPFGLLAAATRRFAAIFDTDSPETQFQKLRERVEKHLDRNDVERVTEFLGELAGINSPLQPSPALKAALHDPMLMNDGIQRAWEDLLTSECRAHPVVIVLEDIHWGDLPTMKCIDSVLRHLRDAPLMVLATAEPEVQQIFPGLWREREAHELRIAPLTRKAAERLVCDALGTEVEKPIVEQLIALSNGNLLHLEELIRATAVGIRLETLPSSVLEVVRNRFGLFAPEARRVLRAASIFGQTFWRDGVIHLVGARWRNTVDEWLEELVKREVFVKSTRGKEQYAFVHPLVREAAYGMLTEEDKILGHQLAGSWLELSGETRASVLAEHFDRGREGQRAIECYVRGAEDALEGNDFAAACLRSDRGVELGAAGKDLGVLRLVQAEAAFWRGELVSAERLASEARNLLPRSSPRYFQSLRVLVAALGNLGRLDCVAALAREVWETPSDKGSEAERAKVRSLVWACRPLMHSGRMLPFRSIVEWLDTLGDLSEIDSRSVAELRQLRANPAEPGNDLSTTLREMTIALSELEAVGDVRAATTARANVGFVCAEFGEFTKAERMLREAIASAQRMGIHHTALLAQHNLGYVLHVLGQRAEALALETRAAEGFRIENNPRLEDTSHVYLGLMALQADDPSAAEKHARTAVGMLSNHPSLLADALAVQSKATLLQGRSRDALALAQHANVVFNEPTNWRRYKVLPRLVQAEAQRAAEGLESGRKGIAVARDHILNESSKIKDPELRNSFLAAVPDNIRVFQLMKEWNTGTRELGNAETTAAR